MVAGAFLYIDFLLNEYDDKRGLSFQSSLRRRAMETSKGYIIATEEEVINRGEQVYALSGELDMEDVEFWTNLVSSKSGCHVTSRIETKYNGMLEHSIIALGDLQAVKEAIIELYPLIEKFKFHSRMTAIFSPSYKRKYMH